MRRFEFVEGTSAKFWSTTVEGSNFVVLYGKIGTPGRRQEKSFPTEDAARKEMEKKIAEKSKEGYREVEGDGTTASATASAPQVAQRPALAPRRGVTGTANVSATTVQAAQKGLENVVATLKGRSWQLARKVSDARDALRSLQGADVSEVPALRGSLTAAIGHVTDKTHALAVHHAMDLLGTLHVSAFTAALDQWSGQTGNARPRAAGFISLITAQRAILADDELTLRLGWLLADGAHAGAHPGWTRRWKSLRPHLDAAITAKGATLKEHLKAMKQTAPPDFVPTIRAMGG